MRSEARTVQRLVSAFVLLASHRGSVVNKAGVSFITALSTVAFGGARQEGPAHSVKPVDRSDGPLDEVRLGPVASSMFPATTQEAPEDLGEIGKCELLPAPLPHREISNKPEIEFACAGARNVSSCPSSIGSGSVALLAVSELAVASARSPVSSVQCAAGALQKSPLDLEIASKTTTSGTDVFDNVELVMVEQLMLTTSRLSPA